MSPKSSPKSLEPRVKVDTVKLNEQLRSCYGITDAQLSEIREILELAQQDIMDYDAEMHRMHLRRELLKSYAEKLTTLLSPIRRLPNEILSRIFMFYCKENDLTSRYPGGAAALTISAVCTRWRELAISQPVLWSDIRFEFLVDWELGHKVEKERQAVLERRVSLHLKRSKIHPLTLDIQPFEHADGHPALWAVVDESQRWKSLTFRPESLWNPSLSLPLLETVTINDSGIDDPDVFAKASIIQSLDFYITPIDEELVKAHSGTLMAIECFVTTSVEQFLSILEPCSKLRRLVLVADNNITPILEPVNPRTLPLSLLQVRAFEDAEEEEEDGYLSCILASLTLPDLADLILVQLRYRTIKIFPTFIILKHFFERSKCRLTTLTMQGLCLTPEEMAVLLLYLPSLRELSIINPDIPNPRYCTISTSFIESLHAWKRCSFLHSIEPIVPNLHSLKLELETEDFDPASFVETIASRWLPGEHSEEFGVACLRSVELHLPKVRDATLYEPLRQIEKAGMRIVVKCQGKYIV